MISSSHSKTPRKLNSGRLICILLQRLSNYQSKKSKYNLADFKPSVLPFHFITQYLNIKIIQYLETLEDRFQCGFLLWGRSLVKSRTNET